jgi:hypothetical protein
VPDAYDLDGKTFRVLRNDGPGAMVTVETVFRFRQDGEVVRSDYEGGGVRVGALLGIVDGASLTLGAGHSTCALERTPDGRIRILDSWEWKGGEGTGECVMEED